MRKAIINFNMERYISYEKHIHVFCGIKTEKMLLSCYTSLFSTNHNTIACPLCCAPAITGLNA